MSGMLEDSFIENTAIEAKASQKIWHILVVDDDKEVHAVTRLALRDMRFENGRVEIVSAHSAQEARALLTKERRNRFAIAIVDVVVETTTAGLDLVKFIRDDINNAIVRIYLRTGQPGHAPERAVIDGYDINGYHAKAELTAQALYTSVLAALRSYRDLVAIERGRRGLECILRSSQSLLGFANMGQFASSALEQLTALIHVENDAVYVGQSGLTVIQASDDYRILAGIGEYREALGRTAWEVLPAHVVDRLRRAERSGEAIAGDNWIAVKAPSGDANALLHLDIDRQLDDVELNLINVFAQQTGLAFANVRLTEEILETQRQIVYVLSESIEARSRETGNHIRRVAKTAALLAELCGMDADTQTLLEAAAPLHDIGKIVVPDAILNKPGKLDPGEWTIMQSHAAAGAEILAKSRGPVFEAGAIIAAQHHERWDGSGYPAGLAGDSIHIYGRIAAIVDVFDALASDRCYKKAWPLERVVALIREQSGVHFDPLLAELLLGNLERFVAIRDAYPDVVV